MKKLHHLFGAALVVFALLLVQGCSGTSSLRQASNTFFEAFNHLCEADSLELSGTIEAQGMQADYIYKASANPQQASFVADLPAGQKASFYLKDGKTYLNYMGEKSSSTAERIGISKEASLRLPNPFLDIPESERASLFDSVKTDKNTYTFTINTNQLSKFLDSYGAVKIDQATLMATIEKEQIQDLDLSVSGTFDLVNSSTPLKLHLSMKTDNIDQPITIDFPADLAAWPKGE